jgi:hypothetical protein
MNKNLVNRRTHLSARKAIAANLIKADYSRAGSQISRDIALRCPDGAARRLYYNPYLSQRDELPVDSCIGNI